MHPGVRSGPKHHGGRLMRKSQRFMQKNVRAIHLIIPHAMESDREEANLGTIIDDTAVPKKPKRRFIGRRADAAAAQPVTKDHGGIEDSKAIQGTSTTELAVRKGIA
ncbi:hypothetical protein K461DRAFT_123956 [Myriangium duriaei CBS 260.36]|uniref:Uncharacterized protein n=1 Tax=Myriangium duriaei CBS 260.36 TaxID=1168546 RepID=A0A9P4MGZ7_9PEZI|nr:hypothetical protein K461DRAFT_123956 [Myriangium duriaei CBS 260.36]